MSADLVFFPFSNEAIIKESNGKTWVKTPIGEENYSSPINYRGGMVFLT